MSTFEPRLDFSASPVLSTMLMDDSFVRFVWGPTGSGKSTLCCGALMQNAMQQPTDKDFVRRSRYVLVRNTAPMLKTTTIKTWLSRFPEKHCGPVRWSSPITHHIKIAPVLKSREADRPGLDAEFIFLPLDTPDDVVKLKSLDVTGAWFNEASEIPPSLVTYMTRRVGRYPEKDGDYQAFRPFVVCDSNATDGDNPMVAFEHEAPVRWRFFHQPPAVLQVDDAGRCVEADARYKGRRFDLPRHPAAGRLWVVNPDAENLRNLYSGYYENTLGGSKLEEIQRDIQVKFVYVQDGKPVVPEFAQSVHVVDTLPLIEDAAIELGGDIGGGTLNPAAVIGQRHPSGTWLIHDELVCEDVALEDYSRALRAKLSSPHLKRDGVEVGRFHGDPAGGKRDELFGTVIFDHLRAAGFNAMPVSTNDLDVRIQAARAPFTRMVRGKPAILIHKRCKALVQALAGKWNYRRLRIAGTENFTAKPDKTHPYSDVADAFTYLLMGGGEERAIRGRDPNRRIAGSTVAPMDFDIFSA